MHFVGFGRTPAPVDREEIAAVERIVATGAPGESCPLLRVGEKVEITSGPLTGLTGFLKEIKGDRRLVVGVSLLQRSLAVELRPSWLVAVPCSRDRAHGRLAAIVPQTV
jgi:transcription antitermination factor NusG